MNRRNLIKTVGLSAIGLATVPWWVDSWSAKTLPASELGLGDEQNQLLTDIVDALIPSSEVPGAKDLEVDKFVKVMVADCFDKGVQEQFVKGLGKFSESVENSQGKAFGELSIEEKTAVLLSEEAAEVASEEEFKFVSFLKNLTISGYMSSEYVSTEILNYELVPSRWHGSFPVSESIYHNA